MALEKEFIDRMRKQLLGERKSVKEKLDKIAVKGDDTPGRYDPRFVDYGESEDDNAMEVEQYTTNLSEERNLAKLLEKTDSALKRIEEGKYGKCPNCEGDMGKERLEAFPAADLCLKCKKEENNK